jgi:hypothetical protein
LSQELMMNTRQLLAPFLVALLSLGTAQAQQRQQAQSNESPTAQKTAPIDLTGYWVSVIDEDWRWRMLTPPKGDFTSVPLNQAGIRQANMWSLEQDGSCKAYGMAGLMRMPTDLHITWAAPDQLKIETDWGQQTRTLYFKSGDAPNAAPSLQGTSVANWEFPVPLAIGQYRPAQGAIDLNGNVISLPQRGARTPGGYLKVSTSNLLPAWLRRNGVPYGPKTHVTEYFQTFTDPIGREWFDVMTVVEDPDFLAQPFITSSDYRKLPDASSWAPHPCKS